MKSIKDINIFAKKLLIRVDFNVPITNGEIADDTRIKAALPTINYALENKAKIILVSHLGRPPTPELTPEFSLKIVADRLQTILSRPIKLVANWQGGINFNSDEIIMLENIRCYPGETENSQALSKQLAALADVFVNDAFSLAHRMHSSNVGVLQYVTFACAGISFAHEIEQLVKLLNAPQKPLTAIVGGAKVSTKLNVLHNLIGKVNNMIVGGGIANTFIKAAGGNIGASVYQSDLVAHAAKIIEFAKIKGIKIVLPTDVVVSKDISPTAETRTVNIADVREDEAIFDVGPETQKAYAEVINRSATILWNGPVGVFELEPFMAGTRALGAAIATSKAFCVAGGGDTIAAINKFELAPQIDYISTAGGAFLEFMEGKVLPAVKALVEFD